MKTNINTRNPNKFYLFHHDNEHDTEDCYALKKEIKILIFNGYLQ